MRAVALVLVLLAVRPCLADEPRYTIQEDLPPTGSSIRRDAVIWNVPLDLRWGEMSEEQKAKVRAWYVKIEPGDEPPFPVDGMRSIADGVRVAQKKLLVDEDVDVVATVAPAGDVVVVKSNNGRTTVMTKFVAALLYRTRFKPAVCGGKPCQMDFPLRFGFRVH